MHKSTAEKKKCRYSLIALCLILLFLCGCIRKKTDWVETAELSSGKKINIKFHHSSYIGFGGHPFYIGGGGDKYDLFFNYDRAEYSWGSEKDERPIVLNINENGFYLAVFDRTQDIDFLFYHAKFKNEFMQILPSEFPIGLAIQNLWLKEEDKKILKAFDPKDYWFRKSLTVKMWSKIYSPETYSYYDGVCH